MFLNVLHAYTLCTTFLSGTLECQKEVSDPLELKLKMDVRATIQVQRTKPRPSGRAVGAPNC